MNDKSVITSTKEWLSSFVIELNLCPFAKREYVSNNIRFSIANVEQEVDLLGMLIEEINFLIANDKVTTTLLIHPKLLNNFDDYNQFLDLTERLLEQHDWVGEFQIASFHPDYQFAGTKQDDAENFTNRSPYPMLHILRESLVEHAIASYPNVDEIPIKNIELMTKIGSKKLSAQLQELVK